MGVFPCRSVSTDDGHSGSREQVAHSIPINPHKDVILNALHELAAIVQIGIKNIEVRLLTCMKWSHLMEPHQDGNCITPFSCFSIQH